SSEYWGASTKNTLLDETSNSNPLLTSLGIQAKDFFDEINNINVSYNKFFTIETNNDSLLHNIQNDIRFYKPPEKNLALDDSIIITNSYSALRELQVLKQYLIKYLTDNKDKQAF